MAHPGAPGVLKLPSVKFEKNENCDPETIAVKFDVLR